MLRRLGKESGLDSAQVALCPNQMYGPATPTEWILRVPSQVVKRPECKADISPQSVTEDDHV